MPSKVKGRKSPKKSQPRKSGAGKSSGTHQEFTVSVPKEIVPTLMKKLATGDTIREKTQFHLVNLALGAELSEMNEKSQERNARKQQRRLEKLTGG